MDDELITSAEQLPDDTPPEPEALPAPEPMPSIEHSSDVPQGFLGGAQRSDYPEKLRYDIPGHTVTVAEVDNPMYPWYTTCTCGFQAHAKTEGQAHYWAQSHEGRQRYIQASKGYQTGHV